MTLYDLVKAKEFLLSYDPSKVLNHIVELKVLLLENCGNVVAHEQLAPSLEGFDLAKNNIRESSLQVKKLIDLLDQQIDQISAQYLQTGYLINDYYPLAWTDPENCRTMRPTVINPTTQSWVIAKIRQHTNSFYPALELGPGDGYWTDNLVAADPLYLVDIFTEFLNKTVGLFPPAYQNRLRPYLIGPEANKSCTDLSDLPQNQFGFVFAWNLFDYLPYDQFDAYLHSCNSIMRPGANMLLSYNNCDDPVGARNVEYGLKSWMTQRLLTKILEKTGFNISNQLSCGQGQYCIELSKPGQLQTVKAHQALGEICNF